MQHIFIVGSKGIPAKYGGFETFVEKLTENKKDKNIQIQKYVYGRRGKESKTFKSK